ncbi:hypothetical protein DFH29DRAFT_1084813 [Suillus ampliporus]|nr:hypothetical protein DFH29DRAFT_1084813 [Suillus ampliporus]
MPRHGRGRRVTIASFSPGPHQTNKRAMVFGLFTRKPDNTQLHHPRPHPKFPTQTHHQHPLHPHHHPIPALPIPQLPPLPHIHSTTTTTTLSPHTLTALTQFFHDLSQPPQLHCVRYHASFFDLSNMDTSCRIPHDDDSALVDRSAYETLWGYCEEGTGDMGPPDGWCYEGRHTEYFYRLQIAKTDSRPLPKSNLYQSHVASPTIDGDSECENDGPPRDADILSRPTRERIKVRPGADVHLCKPRTRSPAREERSLSHTRVTVRVALSSVRVLHERTRDEAKKR